MSKINNHQARPPDRLLNVVDAAAMLGMSVGSLRNMTYRSEIDYVKIGRRGVRYRESALLGWMDAHSVRAQST